MYCVHMDIIMHVCYACVHGYVMHEGMIVTQSLGRA